MKIKIEESNNFIEIKREDDTLLEKYEKDKPTNFKNLLNILVDLKFEEDVVYDEIETDDIQNRAMLNIIYGILKKYNEKYNDFISFKKEHKES